MSESDEGDHLEAIIDHKERDVSYSRQVYGMRRRLKLVANTHSVKSKIIKYHCKWVGHDVDAATWEDADYIQSQCRKEVTRYWRRLKMGKPTNPEMIREAADIEEELAFLDDMKDWEKEISSLSPAHSVNYPSGKEAHEPPNTTPNMSTTSGQHRLPHDHQCSIWSTKTAFSECDRCHQLFKSAESLKEHTDAGCARPIQMCDAGNCGEMDPLTQSDCDGCEGKFCLKHRYPSSHACRSLHAREDKKEQRRLAAQETIKRTFKPAVKGTVTNSTTATSTTNRKTPSKTSSMVELMKAKAKAKIEFITHIKGNTSIPMTSRLYLNVRFPKECNRDPAPMFFDKTTSVGKALDIVADACSVKNVNHRLSADDGQRLELYSEDMMALEKSQPLSNILINLDTIILERQIKKDVML
ncbi:AN1-type zinc finger protein 1 [Apophysomyces ossiformis]|uniref:AN1-type zinc finger protein 1 n=1 Tax=Apophysomyces ossiformis TaxID=679940 RepID=A0A8H7BTJ4_9FUNG|nr:AN1-type zinc finger protein 1 [Apophysomyces ossiformis]